MKKERYEEKIELIGRLMNSYINGNERQSDKWLVDKFDRLYDMDLEALQYLAELRKVKKPTTTTYAEY